MDDSELLNRGKSNELKISWINKAFEHQTHHRGQCVIYLRLPGIEPPHELLF
ncbi:MAG: DinB family protein [Saprospiraceae bacterium]|nr:DinB family protein [Saprospiraceae bacterium]